MGAVVVLGMHRSGTSMVAALLQSLGVNMGENLLEDCPDNPRGHFEDMDFLNMNKRILRENGGSWLSPPDELRIPYHLRKQIDGLMARKTNGKPWGWKDPRTCLTLEAYRSYLKEPDYIVCYRNPLSIARSLKERNDMAIPDAFHLTCIYLSRMWAQIAGERCRILCLSYEEMTDNPQGTVGTLRDFLRTENKGDPSIIDPLLRHF